MKSFPYLPGLSLIFSIRLLTLFQISVYFVNNSLLLSVEAKINYLFPLHSIIYPSILLKRRLRAFTL